MHEIPPPPTALDLPSVLSEIRLEAIRMVTASWAELGQIVDRILPSPLDPMALLPIATGQAAGGELEPLIHVAGIVVLSNLALRLLDDCADQDQPSALYHSLGLGRTTNLALAIQATATWEITQVAVSPKRRKRLGERYMAALLTVCQGQHDDMSALPVADLEAYEALVRLKTVAAYGFAAAAGALVASDEADTIQRCTACGEELGWMAQLLDDMEALWWPVEDAAREIRKRTYPIWIGLATEHPDAAQLAAMCLGPGPILYDIPRFLDRMQVRPRVLERALDHRDRALEILGHTSFAPAGVSILQLWLSWLLRDATTLLSAPPGVGGRSG